MSNKYFSVALYIFLISGFVPISVHSEESENVTLRWEAVPSALGYIIEIRDSEGKVVESKRISTNYYEISKYSPGSYQHRVGVLNKFGKLETFTEWSSFQILRSVTPIVYSDKIYSAGLDEETIKIQIRGKNFLPDMKIYLMKKKEITRSVWEFENYSLKGKFDSIPEERIVKPVNYEVKSDSLVVAEFHARDIENLGTYDIILENPKKKKAIVPKSFIIAATKEKAEKIALRREKILKNEIPAGYYDTPYWSTFWRSVLVPGWGQYYIDDARWKLYVYPAILVGAGYIYISSYREFLVSRRRYYTSIERGYFLGSSEYPEWLFVLNYQTATSQYNSSRRKLERVQIATGLIALFAIYNMVDSYLSVKRNIAGLQSNPFSYSFDSPWTIETNSELRSLSEMNHVNLETYTNLEFKWRF